MNEKKIKNVAVLCSGGDAPGMNAAIRAVVRTCIYHGLTPWGIRRGYQGLLKSDFSRLDSSSVGNIIQRGGTILQTSRCPEFHEKEHRARAAEILKVKKIDGLIVLGGDGSFKGAHKLASEHDIPVIGIPCTIDNDISGTEYTIGFESAVQTAVEAVDKIRDTASSHDRTFIVEVMGRSSTAIATHVGLCTGAENIIYPQGDLCVNEIATSIKRGIKRGKTSSIIIVAEGASSGASYQIKEHLKSSHNLDSHVCILGHIQRGGTPSSTDRFIASQMGHFAVNSLTQYKGTPLATVFLKGENKVCDLELCLEKVNEYQIPYLEITKTLSI